MKKILLNLIISSAICFSVDASAQTSGTLTFTFTEVAQAITYSGNAQHVLAAWVQTSAGAFVKTKLRYVGGITSDHLPTWASNALCTSGVATSSGCNTVDATTGATCSAWKTYTISWDGCKGAAGTGILQPDGVYKVTLQSTWNHGTAYTTVASYTFTKGAAVDHQTPAANAYFSGITLNWQAAAPVANFVTSTTKCVSNAISFTDQSTNTPTSWSWSFPGATVTSSTLQNPTATYASAGTYTVTHTATNASGTSTVVSQSIVVSASPSVAVSNATVCAGAAANIIASGATTYNWNTGATTSSITVSPTSTSNYTVTGTNASGCTNTKTLSVTVNTAPVVAANNGTICSGGMINLMASGATSYNWNTGATTNSITVTPTSTANYTVTGTTSGCSNTKTISVTVNALPTIVVNSTTICASSTATLSASGANTYAWNTGATTANLTASPTTNTTYTVTGTSVAGCVKTATASIIVGSAPAITVNSTSICVGSSASLTASGVTSYTWNTGANTPGITVNPTSTTVYTVSGNLVGCASSAVKTTTVTVNALPTVTLSSITGPLCVNSSTQSLSGSPAGGVYLGTGVSGSVFNPSASGSGTFTITYSYTNTAGCSATSSHTVSVGLCTGIAESNNVSYISIYPNPVNELLYVTLESSLINNSTIELYDMIGHLIMTEKPNAETTELSLANLSKGMYMIRVVSSNGQRFIKLIKE